MTDLAATSEGRGVVVLASAGTGKTWQLTTRYVDLLLEGVPPETILASTFTRKAAREIQERVFGRLLEALASEAGRAELEGAVGRPLERALILERVVHLARHVDRMAVSTLDAVFQQLAGTVARRLGLPTGWRIADEDEDAVLRRDAVSDTITAMGEAETAALLATLKKDELRRSAHGALLGAVGGAHGAWLDSDAGAWEPLRLPEPLGEEELALVLDAVRDAAVPLTAKKKENRNWAKARDGLVAAMVAEDWKDLLTKGLPKVVLTGASDYYKVDVTDQGDPSARALLELTRPLVAHASHHVLAGLQRRSRALWTLVERFDHAYRRRQDRRRLYRFDDVPRLLSGPGHLAAALARRQAPVDHLLLDEFQDTSVPQWALLRPLIDEVLAPAREGASLFCVGDVKQSIYGWRAGEPRLLTGLAGRDGMAPPRELHVSRRSAPVVLETVNAAFARLEANPALADGHGAAARAWAEGFVTHEAHHTGLEGSARLTEVPSPAEDAEGRRRDVLEAAADRVVEVVADDPEGTVGVLVRKTARINPLLHALRSRGLHASGEGGAPLVDAEAVTLLLSGLVLADHPGDTAARFHLATSPLAEGLGLTDARDGAAARTWSTTVRRRLLDEGHGPTLAAWSDLVRDSSAFTDWDRSRVEQLVDLAYAWDGREAGRPGDFVRMVRETRVECPTADPVAVMTVHAAKGLEFDTVVLPDLDGAWISRRQALMTSRRDPEAGLDAVFPDVAEAYRRLAPELEALDRATVTRTIQEELCVLYVALTRARRRLEVLVGPAPAKGSPAALLTWALAGEVEEPGARAGDEGATENPETVPVVRRGAPEDAPDDESSTAAPRVLWEHPDSVRAPVREPEGPARQEPVAPPAPVRLDRGAGARRRASPSSLEGGDAVPATRLLQFRGDTGRLRGLLVHRWFQEVEWLDEFDRGDDALLELGRRHLESSGSRVDEELLAEALGVFRASLSRPHTAAVLSRPESEARVWRERAFLVEDEDGPGGRGVSRGTFDRVVVHGPMDSPTSAQVIDFKTDSVPTTDRLAERVELHRPQLAAYGRAVARLTGLTPDRVTATLVFVSDDRVVAL